MTQMPDAQDGRILLKWKPQFIERATPNGKSFTTDYSIVLLTAEEMIAAGATELVVSLSPDDISDIEARAPALKNRLISGDSRHIQEVVATILTPVFEEYQIENDLIHCFTFKHPIKEELADRVVSLSSYLHDFLIALTNQAQLDIDFQRFITTVRDVRANLRSPHGRTNLAVIEGILNTYEPQQVACVELNPKTSIRGIDLFHEFLEDQIYRNLSRNALALGFPEKAKAAKQGFSLLATSLVKSSKFATYTQLGNLNLNTAATLPSATSELSEYLLGKGYLPPVVFLKHIRERATEQYKLIKPDPLIPAQIKRWLSERE